MRKVEIVKVKSGTLAGKGFRMVQGKDGRWCPRDPAYPIDAPASVAKTGVAAAKVSELESTKKAVEVAKVAAQQVAKGKVK